MPLAVRASIYQGKNRHRLGPKRKSIIKRTPGPATRNSKALIPDKANPLKDEGVTRGKLGLLLKERVDLSPLPLFGLQRHRSIL